MEGPPRLRGAVAAAAVVENPQGGAGGRRVADEAARILDYELEVERLEGIEEGQVAVLVAGHENRSEASDSCGVA